MTSTAIPLPAPRSSSTQYHVLGAVSFLPFAQRHVAGAAACGLSDFARRLQSVVCPDRLSALVYQITASILQPFIGFYTDKHPKPFALPFAMLASGCGLMLLAFAGSYAG